jgi:hypothetical protein
MIGIGCLIQLTFPRQLLHHPDLVGWFTAGDRTMHICLLFSFTSLELHCSIVDIACISSFLSFLHILLGFVVNTAVVYRIVTPRVIPPLGGSQTLESTTVTCHAERQGARVYDSNRGPRGS